MILELICQKNDSSRSLPSIMVFFTEPSNSSRLSLYSNFVDCWSVDEIIAIDVTRPGQGKRENFLKAVRDLSKKCFCATDGWQVVLGPLHMWNSFCGVVQTRCRSTISRFISLQWSAIWQKIWISMYCRLSGRKTMR